MVIFGNERKYESTLFCHECKIYCILLAIWKAFIEHSAFQTKCILLLCLFGPKTVFCAQLDIRRNFLQRFCKYARDEFFWGILRSCAHRKVANPATTNSSFTDPIHESFFLFISFFVNKHKGWTYFFWPHPPFYTSWLQFSTPTDQLLTCHTAASKPFRNTWVFHISALHSLVQKIDSWKKMLVPD